MSSVIDSAKYISFTTFKKDGTAVSAPVWVVPYGDGYAFTTDPTSFKVKRVQNNPRCTVSVCDMRGKVAPGTAVFNGTAQVLNDAETASVTSLIKKKYRIGWMMLGVYSLVKKLTRSGTTASGECAIAVTLSA
jgi:PPOX class probable F420-dependent enzyme